jgi:hypothetical protein
VRVAGAPGAARIGDEAASGPHRISWPPGGAAAHSVIVAAALSICSGKPAACAISSRVRMDPLFNLLNAFSFLTRWVAHLGGDRPFKPLYSLTKRSVPGLRPTLAA